MWVHPIVKDACANVNGFSLLAILRRLAHFQLQLQAAMAADLQGLAPSLPPRRVLSLLARPHRPRTVSA